MDGVESKEGGETLFGDIKQTNKIIKIWIYKERKS